jgi:hypothetical protein
MDGAALDGQWQIDIHSLREGASNLIKGNFRDLAAVRLTLGLEA